MLKLNAEDLLILQFLAVNSKTHISEIAKTAGISERTVSRRIAALERNSYIQGYRALLRPDVEEALSNGLLGENLKIRLSLKEWQAMFESLSRFLGVGGSIVSSQAGEAVGRELGRALKPDADASKALVTLASALERRGLFHMVLCQIDNETCRGVIEVESLQGQEGTEGHDVINYWIKGLLSGYLRQILGESVTVLAKADSLSRKPCFTWRKEL